ncbi:MAG: hypothetical protein CR978_00360 [Gammaproteobacteria bacterium]|nr:MAG: hypothetical protein CR978_00360 [Gammaproteobacteria bacterium]PIE37400.1 MAG: hypothetical protein CSA53_06340 [Gammaproteobacteria bacterium]
MNKFLFAAAVTALVSGCVVVDEQASQGIQPGLTKADRAKVANDDRGHRSRPMTKKGLDRVLKEYDANGDDSVTWAEYNDWRRARFDKTDTNSNGTVDEEEYVNEYEARFNASLKKEHARHQEQTKRRFAALDKDDNEMLAFAEYEKSGNGMFSRWDCDNNSVVNAVDKQCKKAHKAGKKHRRSFLRMPTSHSLRGFMRLYDANDDGEVSKREFDRERRTTFHLTDANKDGKVNFSEYADEYNARLDTAMQRTRRGAIRQTYIRFAVLDDNDDDMMTFDEFQLSGKRIFVRWDKNGDGVVSAADIGVAD